MKLFRNREVKIEFALEFMLAIVATGMTFSIDSRCGWIVLVLAFGLLLIHWLFTYLRYRRISQYAAELDLILHGEKELSFADYQEGELAILHAEIHKMTLRLEEQRQQLLEDRRYLSDSIADISHQLRTPLTSINLILSFLADPMIEKEKSKRLLHEVEHLLARIDWLITTLLKISKLDAGMVEFRKEEMKLEDLISKSCDPLLIPIELKGIRLESEASGDFFGDLAWTGEAIGNIVKNCMEHTPEGGTIWIHATENPLYTELVISDDGPGIDVADLPHIFERFYKGKDSKTESFGVGLALARMIIHSQNGIIKVSNRKPNGAEFTLRFYKGIV